VHYPGLKSHPQHAIANEHFSAAGWLLSIELRDDVDCFDYLNRLQLGVISSNLGDTRTLVIPVAHTIFFEIGKEKRAEMGIAESLIRISVGIEDTDDLIEDFLQALG
jgi:O-acetylhomoserine (thiol)-lyase